MYMGKYYKSKKKAIRKGQYLARKYPRREVHVVESGRGAFVHTHTKWKRR